MATTKLNPCPFCLNSLEDYGGITCHSQTATIQEVFLTPSGEIDYGEFEYGESDTTGYSCPACYHAYTLEEAAQVLGCDKNLLAKPVNVGGH